MTHFYNQFYTEKFGILQFESSKGKAAVKRCSDRSSQQSRKEDACLGDQNTKEKKSIKERKQMSG